LSAAGRLLVPVGPEEPGQIPSANCHREDGSQNVITGDEVEDLHGCDHPKNRNYAAKRRLLYHV
jgi:hypothetical protein